MYKKIFQFLFRDKIKIYFNILKLGAIIVFVLCFFPWSFFLFLFSRLLCSSTLLFFSHIFLLFFSFFAFSSVCEPLVDCVSFAHDPFSSSLDALSLGGLTRKNCNNSVILNNLLTSSALDSTLYGMSGWSRLGLQ